MAKDSIFSKMTILFFCLYSFFKVTSAENIEKMDANHLLRISAVVGDIKGAQNALDCGANINGEGTHFTPLTYAIFGNKLNMIIFLLDNKADIDFQDSRGNTALIEAAYNHREEIIETLLEKGANFNIKNNENETFLNIITNRYEFDNFFTCLKFIRGVKRRQLLEILQSSKLSLFLVQTITSYL